MEKYSHRTHWLRKVQDNLQGMAEPTLIWANRWGLFPDTEISRQLSINQELHPDDVTLTGLELTVRASKALAESAGNITQLGTLGLSFLLDGFDGAIARSKNLASPEGAIKDVVADRLGDIAMARIISGRITNQLTASFSLSALTKAYAAMAGVATTEGGIGSMMERRRWLRKAIIQTGMINSGILKPWLTHAINRNLQSLRNLGVEGARARAKQLVGKNLTAEMADPDSFAAKEAGKYAALILMNRELCIGVESELKHLLDGLSFPSPEKLMAEYPYIRNRVDGAFEFVKKAMAVIDGCWI